MANANDTTTLQPLAATTDQLQTTTTAEQYAAVIDAFLADVATTKASTRNTYRKSLRAFFAWVTETGRDIKTMAKADIVAYMLYLLPTDEDDPNGKSVLTAASYLTAVKLFYKWAADNLAYPNIAANVKLPKRARKFYKEPLTTDEAHKLVEEVEATDSLRNVAIINLLLRCGLRTIEVVNANVEDLKTKAGRVVLHVKGKGRNDKSDFVIVSPKVKAAIDAYLNTRPTARPKDPLFTSVSHNNDGGRLTTCAVSGLAKKHLRAIGLGSREYTAHSLRHTCACSMLDATNDLGQVQETLRHANIATTQIYTYHTAERRRLQAAPELLLDNLF